ncbi:MAG: acyltransferase [Bacteroidales bacterium]|jgi:hypothetical protein|nr:acyltransferase [Bacteroidales bacterium]
MIKEDFEAIRPYKDEEIPDAVQRVAENIHFPEVVKYLFPNTDLRTFTTDFKKIKTVDEFQTQIMNNVVRSIIKHTTDEFTSSVSPRLTNDKNYMFIANHRDIMLDSAFLQIVLHEHGLKTSEITFGSNLMISPFIVDVGKMNKMFRIERGGTQREIFVNSLEVSRYMRYAITQKKQSTWIAQRNGRTKNGFDSTEAAVLKMFAMSGKSGFVPDLKELNITPVVISYEYEPCDFLKTRELYISKRKEYIKDSSEDLLSIMHGVKQQKGKVHLVVCDAITEEELLYCDSFPHNEKYRQLARLIDKKVYDNYKLWKTNYIAHDLLHDRSSYSHHYSSEEKEAFKVYMANGLRDIEGDIQELKTIFLQIYATPTDNVEN